MKIPKHTCCSIELSDYNLIFIHLMGSTNIQADSISRLSTLDIYKKLLEKPKASDPTTCVAGMATTNIQTLSNEKTSHQTKEGNSL